jgi:hypothetical protein
LPFLVTQDPQSDKGREYKAEMEYKYDYFCNNLNNLKAKQPHNNGTNGGLAYRFGQGGYNERNIKDLEIKSRPHSNGTSGGLAYHFDQGGCNKRNARKINSNSSLHDFARMA